MRSASSEGVVGKVAASFAEFRLCSSALSCLGHTLLLMLTMNGLVPYKTGLLFLRPARGAHELWLSGAIRNELMEEAGFPLVKALSMEGVLEPEEFVIKVVTEFV